MVSLQPKTKNGCHNVVYGSIILKIVLVTHLTYENQWGKLRTKIQTFVFFWDTLMDIAGEVRIVVAVEAAAETDPSAVFLNIA